MTYCPDENSQDDLVNKMYYDKKVLGYSTYSFNDMVGVKVIYSSKLEDEILDSVYEDLS